MKPEERAKELAHLVAEDVDVSDSKTAIARILAYRDEVLEEAANAVEGFTYDECVDSDCVELREILAEAEIRALKSGAK